MYVNVMMYNIRSGAIWWQIPYFLSGAIVMFALSITICEIFANEIKCQTFYIKNEGQDQGEEKRVLRYRLEMFDSVKAFFTILADWEYMSTSTGIT